MKKSWLKSKTFWGAVALFVAGGLEALGYGGACEFIKNIAGVVGIPLVAIGLRTAMK